MRRNCELALVVGVTGHRAFAHAEKIELGVVEALRRVTRRFSDRPLTILSSLAEGADRLVAEQTLTQPSARLVVLLPLSSGEYAKDFQTAESKAEFEGLLARADEVVELPPQPSRRDAYRAAGLYILDRCDVLIAVWDGKDGQGASGTAEIVAEARRRGLPIAWVHAGNRKLGTKEPTSLGAEQGSVTFENC